MTADRHALTDADVWILILEGCNANEIAAYAGVTVSCAHALMAHATRTYARAAA